MAKSAGGVRGDASSHKTTETIIPANTPVLIGQPHPQTIQDFADEVMADKQKKGRSIKIGNLNEVAKRELQNMGIKLKSDEVLLTDDTVIKYMYHPKKDKGAAIPHDRYNKIKNVVNNPKHIYHDTKQKELVLIFTGKYGKGKVLKVVIQPNFKKGTTYFNKAKSIGIVDAHQMNNTKQFKKLK